VTFPTTLAEFNKRRPAFEAWLLANGSSVLAPTNSYEVIRFVGTENTCVVYRNDKNRILPNHWQHGAQAAFSAFIGQKSWRATKRVRTGDRKRINQIRSIAQRDGWICSYCPTVLTEETATREHFLSKTHGGSDHLANLGLSCGPCNEKVNHLSVREKIEIAIRGKTADG
jgi:hypothetical protein